MKPEHTILIVWLLIVVGIFLGSLRHHSRFYRGMSSWKRPRLLIFVTTPNGEIFEGVESMKSISKLGVLVAVAVVNQARQTIPTSALLEKPGFAIDAAFSLKVSDDGLSVLVTPNTDQASDGTLHVTLGGLAEQIDLHYDGEVVQPPQPSPDQADNVPAGLVLTVTDVLPEAAATADAAAVATDAAPTAKAAAGAEG